VVGGFAARFLEGMDAAEFAWFEALLDEQDVDILAWAFSTAPPPADLECAMMTRLRALDYLALPDRGAR
jgi:antitoxin CptB